MCTSCAIQSVAASFDDGASARLATKREQDPFHVDLGPAGAAQRVAIAAPMPSRRHSPSST